MSCWTGASLGLVGWTESRVYRNLEKAEMINLHTHQLPGSSPKNRAGNQCAVQVWAGEGGKEDLDRRKELEHSEPVWSWSLTPSRQLLCTFNMTTLLTSTFIFLIILPLRWYFLNIRCTCRYQSFRDFYFDILVEGLFSRGKKSNPMTGWSVFTSLSANLLWTKAWEVRFLCHDWNLLRGNLA